MTTVRTLVVPRPGVLGLEETPEPPLLEGRFRGEAVYSGVSAGTGLTRYRGASPCPATGWEAERGLFDPALGARSLPVRRLGYCGDWAAWRPPG